MSSLPTTKLYSVEFDIGTLATPMAGLWGEAYSIKSYAQLTVTLDNACCNEKMWPKIREQKKSPGVFSLIKFLSSCFLHLFLCALRQK